MTQRKHPPKLSLFGEAEVTWQIQEPGSAPIVKNEGTMGKLREKKGQW